MYIALETVYRHFRVLALFLRSFPCILIAQTEIAHAPVVTVQNLKRAISRLLASAHIVGDVLG